MTKIRKAVVPVAGMGTRFLPITKTIPKEMIPVVDKPLLHQIVLELVAAGVKQIILVTSDTKQTIEKYFQPDPQLEKKLAESGKEEELEMIRAIPRLAQFSFVRQKSQRGTGDAFLTAKDLVGNEPFFGCWGDDILLAKPQNRFQQLKAAWDKHPGNIVACLNDDRPESTLKYGFAKGQGVEPGLIKTEVIIEKPGVENKPSNLAVLSGFIFMPEIFNAWENFPISENKELHYIDGLNILREKGIDTYALEIKNGTYYDCGNIASYLQANLELALQDPHYGPALKNFIQRL